MKTIYSAPNEEAALQALDKFEKKWNHKYAYAVKSWRNNWKTLSTFFKYPPEIRRVMYTTNLIENLHRKIRKVTKTKSSFPSDTSLIKLLYLIVNHTTGKWKNPVKEWGTIINQLHIYYPQRIEQHL